MENKFRIIDQVTGEIYHSDDEGVQLIFEKGGWSLWEICGLITDQDEGLLFRYTGLKDKNGVEIYEGDVVAYEQRNLEQALGIKDGEHYLSFTREIKYRDQGFNVPQGFTRDLEVIGNIYENPELVDSNA